MSACQVHIGFGVTTVTHVWPWAGSGPIPAGTPCDCGLARFASVASRSTAVPPPSAGQTVTDCDDGTCGLCRSCASQPPAAPRKDYAECCPRCHAVWQVVDTPYSGMVEAMVKERNDPHCDNPWHRVPAAALRAATPTHQEEK